DGIRDKLVTGVQTCALPISPIPNANVDAAPTKSIAAATPPPVAFISAFCAPSAVGSMTSPAPASRAMFHLLLSTSATIGGDGYKIGRASCRERGAECGGGLT